MRIILIFSALWVIDPAKSMPYHTRINAEWKNMSRYFVFGNPIAHSLSPALHALFAAQCDLTIDYQPCYVPLNQFKETVDACRAQPMAGANVTAPFKGDALAYADQLTERALLAGAVNTLVIAQGKCIGDNTDGAGFMRDLKNNHFSLHQKKILIIGAGGAARGILSGMIAETPQQIVIMNRTREKALQLRDFFQPYLPITLFSDEIAFDILINATSLDFSDFQWKADLSHTICLDLNYGARHHTFLHWAKTRGAKIIQDGIGTLIAQGALSFFAWTHVMPETKHIASLL
jgi:shikimate dehydrogenase